MAGQIIYYFDRRRGSLEAERPCEGGWLARLYHGSSVLGGAAAALGRGWFSTFLGRILARPCPRRRMEAFAGKAGVDLADLDRPLDSYPSLREFFSRSIDLSRRPLHPDPNVCLAPCDGKVLVHPRLPPEKTFSLKRNVFTLARFLADEGLTRRFAHGALVISRLSLGDYHRFHFPDSGTPMWTVSIPGPRSSDGPRPGRPRPPRCPGNHRMLTLFESDNFGPILMAEVGGPAVGSIRQTFRADSRQTRGGAKGRFELAGSAVVLLFEPGRIRIDPDLCRNSLMGLETYVRLGESLGSGTGRRQRPVQSGELSLR